MTSVNNVDLVTIISISKYINCIWSYDWPVNLWYYILYCFALQSDSSHYFIFSVRRRLVNWLQSSFEGDPRVYVRSLRKPDFSQIVTNLAAQFRTFSSSSWRPTPEGSQTELLYPRTGRRMQQSFYAAYFYILLTVTGIWNSHRS